MNRRRHGGKLLQHIALKLARDASGGGGDRNGALRGRRRRLCHDLGDEGADDGATVQERLDQTTARRPHGVILWEQEQVQYQEQRAATSTST